MEFTDINDAFSIRVNPLGANAVGAGSSSSTPLGNIPPPPQMNTNEQVVVLPSMSQTPSPSGVYPDTVVPDPSRTQRASAQHSAYAPSAYPFIDAGSLAPPTVGEPGYLERMGARRKDLVKLFILSLMIALGISVHWLGSHYVAEFIDSSDFTARQRLAIRIAYPAAIAFVIWNLKAFQ